MSDTDANKGAPLEVKKEEKAVTMTQSQLKELLADVASGFEQKLKERDDKIALLQDASDITLMSKALSKRATGPQKRTMRISTYTNPDTQAKHVVVGWEWVLDKGAYKINGIWQEHQIIRIHLEKDGDVEVPSVDMKYDAFVEVLSSGKVVCDCIGQTTDEDGNITYKLKRQDNGKVLDLGAAFVN